jgi:ABC-type branched-subunit amino acid transport system permease subunit
MLAVVALAAPWCVPSAPLEQLSVVQAASGEVILMTLLGGTGTFADPVVGAAIIVTLQEYLSDLARGWVTVIIGAIFVACVLTFRRGIVGELYAAATHLKFHKKS